MFEGTYVSKFQLSIVVSFNRTTGYFVFLSKGEKARRAASRWCAPRPVLFNTPPPRDVTVFAVL